MDGFINLPTGPKREYAIQQRVDRVEGFDMLRGIAAVMVVISHIVAVTYNPQLNETTTSFAKEIGWSFGAIGVDLFLVLSGFVVARAYKRQTDTGLTYFDFLRGRLIRLMPVYLLSYVIAVSVWILLMFHAAPNNGGATLRLGHGELDIYTLAVNLFPLWVNHGQIVLNPPWWTITVEILAALAMPLLIAITVKRGVKGPFILGLILCLASIPLDFWLGFNTRLLVGLAPITLGILMGLFPMPAGKVRSKRLLFYGALILAGAGALRPGFGDYEYTLRLIAMNGAALVLLSFSTFRITSLGTRFLRQLGCASYTLYAIHYPIIIGLIHLAPQQATADQLTLLATMAGLVAIAISFPLSKLIDNKAIKTSRAYTSKKAKILEQKDFSGVEKAVKINPIIS